MHELFTAYITEHRSDLFATAYGLTRDPHDAEDAVQEAVTAAYLKLDQCTSAELLPGWLHTITLNSARSVQKRRRRELPARNMGELDSHVAAALAEEPDLDRGKAIGHAAEQMPGEFELLLEHHGGGRSAAEIARSHGLPTGTMNSRMYRAREKLLPELTGLAMQVLAEVYGQTFGPRLLARTQLIPVKPLTSRGGRVFVMHSTNGANAFMLTVRSLDQIARGAPLNGVGTGGIVLDQDSVYGFTARRVRGRDIEEVDWDRGFLEALENDQPISITRNLLDAATIGAPLSQERLGEIADSIWQRLTTHDDAAEARALELELSCGDPERCLRAASALLHKRLVEPVEAQLRREKFSAPDQEACRLAALGFAARHVGDRPRALELFAEAQRKQRGNWEWNYHLAEAQSVLGDSQAAAASLVVALRRDVTGLAYIAIRGNPALRPFLGVPRLWRLLPHGAGTLPKARPFLPHEPFWISQTFDARAG